jgi:hypothetical protein
MRSVAAGRSKDKGGDDMRVLPAVDAKNSRIGRALRPSAEFRSPGIEKIDDVIP